MTSFEYFILFFLIQIKKIQNNCIFIALILHLACLGWVRSADLSLLKFNLPLHYRTKYLLQLLFNHFIHLYLHQPKFQYWNSTPPFITYSNFKQVFTLGFPSFTNLNSTTFISYFSRRFVISLILVIYLVQVYFIQT